MDLNERKTKLEAELFNLDNELKNIRNILGQKERNYLLVTGKLIQVNEQLAVVPVEEVIEIPKEIPEEIIE